MIQSMYKKFIFIIIGIIITTNLLFLFISSGNAGISETYDYKYNFKEQEIDDEIVVVTYNVGYFSGFDNVGLRYGGNRAESEIPPTEKTDLLAKAVKALTPLNIDILATQEIDIHSHRSSMVHHVNGLANGLRFPNAHFLVNWNKKFIPYPVTKPKKWIGKVISGQAIFSKYHSENIEIVRLEKPNNDFLTNLFYFERYAQVIKTKIGNREIYVLNTHLEAFTDAVNARQGKEILRSYKKYSALKPTLLLGDLNNNSVNKTLKLILNAENIAIVSTDEPTAPSFNPKSRIDHIFYNPRHFKLLETRVLSKINTPSDHLPLLAKFKLL